MLKCFGLWKNCKKTSFFNKKTLIFVIYSVWKCGSKKTRVANPRELKPREPGTPCIGLLFHRRIYNLSILKINSLFTRENFFTIFVLFSIRMQLTGLSNSSRGLSNKKVTLFKVIPKVKAMISWPRISCANISLSF